MTVQTLKHRFTKIRTVGERMGERMEHTTIKLSLADDCKNGHEDFSLTADIQEKDKRGRWVESGGGCCHDHILELMPELKPFADLHLCTWEGVPMHAVANGWYWLQGVSPEIADHDKSLRACRGGTGSGAKSPQECRRIFGEHFRVTDAEIDQILALFPRSEKELQIITEDMDLPARWKKEAAAAIAQLEAWTGATFESNATRKTWEPVSKGERELYQHRKASGYYSPEQVAARDAEKASAVKAARIAELKSDHQESVQKLESELAVALYLAERFAGNVNAIYYNHSNTLQFNWCNHEKLLSRPEFEAFVAAAEMAKLPQDIKFAFQERPTR